MELRLLWEVLKSQIVSYPMGDAGGKSLQTGMPAPGEMQAFPSVRCRPAFLRRIEITQSGE